ncbi:MAG: hypothetical protein AAF125_15200, partial [Chloroflexota bacterium]
DHLTDSPEDSNARRLRVQVVIRLKFEGTDHLLGALDDLDALDEQTTQDSYTRSIIFEQLEDLPEAIEAARAATATDDESASARATGRMLDLMLKAGEVEEALEIALANDWVQFAADAAAQLEDPRMAIQYYTQALDRTASLAATAGDDIAANIRARVLLKRASAYQVQAAWPEADADYVAAARIVPDDPMIPFNRGVVTFHMGRVAAARVLLTEAAEAASDYIKRLMTEAAAEDDALAALWREIAGDPEDDEA